MPWPSVMAYIGEHLVVILKPRTEAKAVVARRIDIHGALVARVAHRRVVLHAVGNGRHQAVVACHDDKCRWREMTAHSVLRREISHQFRVLLSFLAKEVAARPLVRHCLVHRDYRIEKY